MYQAAAGMAIWQLRSGACVHIQEGAFMPPRDPRPLAAAAEGSAPAGLGRQVGLGEEAREFIMQQLPLFQVGCLWCASGSWASKVAGCKSCCTTAGMREVRKEHLAFRVCRRCYVYARRCCWCRSFFAACGICCRGSARGSAVELQPRLSTVLIQCFWRL